MTKADLHRLVDGLPEASVDAAATLLARVGADPVLAVHLLTPVDDEPLTAEDEADIAEAEAALARGETTPWDQLKAELDAAD
ncbi:MAG: hypothetical protein DLM65_05520 [Candidatus Aeolococcus gillhamiae]|uniref:Addiction module protein n=1 Tax=Candidatus Aeolococcus gillhamiae TaxID=3127015 RepID=A0A2W5Z8E6_9BACT|nr:MAG: hypothetical protein DLM65_05520 [Candidatus Dormibacter sp. RRmetagenome_bin12]